MWKDFLNINNYLIVCPPNHSSTKLVLSFPQSSVLLTLFPFQCSAFPALQTSGVGMISKHRADLHLGKRFRDMQARMEAKSNF